MPDQPRAAFRLKTGPNLGLGHARCRLSKLCATPAAKPSGSDPNATKTAPDPAAAADQALTKAPSWSAEMVLGGLQVTGRRATRNGAGPFVRRARLGPFSRNGKLPFGRAACLDLDEGAWARHPGLPPLRTRTTPTVLAR